MIIMITIIIIIIITVLAMIGSNTTTNEHDGNYYHHSWHPAHVSVSGVLFCPSFLTFSLGLPLSLYENARVYFLRYFFLCSVFWSTCSIQLSTVLFIYNAVYVHVCVHIYIYIYIYSIIIHCIISYHIITYYHFQTCCWPVLAHCVEERVQQQRDVGLRRPYLILLCFYFLVLSSVLFLTISY